MALFKMNQGGFDTGFQKGYVLKTGVLCESVAENKGNWGVTTNQGEATTKLDIPTGCIPVCITNPTRTVFGATGNNGTMTITDSTGATLLKLGYGSNGNNPIASGDGTNWSGNNLFLCPYVIHPETIDISWIQLTLSTGYWNESGTLACTMWLEKKGANVQAVRVDSIIDLGKLGYKVMFGSLCSVSGKSAQNDVTESLAIPEGRVPLAIKCSGTWQASHLGKAATYIKLYTDSDKSLLAFGKEDGNNFSNLGTDFYVCPWGSEPSNFEIKSISARAHGGNTGQCYVGNMECVMWLEKAKK